jgi:stage V sporulation protein AF
MENLSELYMENTAWFDWMLGVGRSLDMVSRDYIIGERRARLWVVDGYGKDETLERMGAFWLTLKPEQLEDLADMQAFADRFISFSETRISFLFSFSAIVSAMTVVFQNEITVLFCVSA